MTNTSNTTGFIIVLGNDSAQDRAQAIDTFKKNLVKFLADNQLPATAVRTETEWRKFGMIMVLCEPQVAELLRKMPGVSSVAPNGRARPLEEVLD